MDLSLDRPGTYLFVRRVGARSITVVDRELTTSFLLSPDVLLGQAAGLCSGTPVPGAKLLFCTSAGSGLGGARPTPRVAAFAWLTNA